ncbi:MAG: hypothetical protein ACI8W9_001797, partial [Psychromonas sp.]
SIISMADIAETTKEPSKCQRKSYRDSSLPPSK